MNKEKNLIITDVMGEITSDRKDGKTPKGYLFKIPVFLFTVQMVNHSQVW